MVGEVNEFGSAVGLAQWLIYSRFLIQILTVIKHPERGQWDTIHRRGPVPVLSYSSSLLPQFGNWRVFNKTEILTSKESILSMGALKM